MKRIILVVLFLIFISTMMFKAADSMPSSRKGGRRGNLNKPTCYKPNQTDLETSLSNALSTEITIVDYHFSCLAVRASGLFDSLAVIVKYNITFDSHVTAQIVMQCDDDSMWETDMSQVVSIDDTVFAGLLPSTQYQCYKCASSKPNSGPGSDNTWNESTWCLECSDNCKQMGGGFCISPSTYSCCPYFTKQEGICVDTCNMTVNSSNHCTDQCKGNWTGIDCQNCSIECFNGGQSDTSCTMCMCPDGYTGTYCEEQITICDNICLNGGETDPSNCSKCICPSDYIGDHCEEVVVGPCDSNPCLNGGTCLEDSDEYLCVCPIGWTGTNCETDQCSDYCKNGGLCIITERGDVTCDCNHTSFTGPTCEEEIDPCRDDICQNGGTCVSLGGDAMECECTDGFTGSQCEDVIDNCPCLNGGYCERLEGVQICFCPEEFVGPLCEYPNPCLPNPCNNGGTCTVQRGYTHTCTCDQGWTGSACETCYDTGDNECSTIQPTRELLVEDGGNNYIGLIIGIVFAVILLIMLIASFALLGMIVYKRFGRIQDESKSVEVDDGAFSGSKVMVNPVFIRPDDLSIEESAKTKVAV